MRVYEIAKEVGIPNKDLIAKIRALGLEVNNHMSSLDADDVARIRRSLDKEKSGVVQPAQTQKLSSGTVLRRRSTGDKSEPPVEERPSERAKPVAHPPAPAAQAPVIRRRVAEPVESGGRSESAPLHVGPTGRSESAAARSESAGARSEAAHHAPEVRATKPEPAAPVTRRSEPKIAPPVERAPEPSIGVVAAPPAPHPEPRAERAPEPPPAVVEVPREPVRVQAPPAPVIVTPPPVESRPVASAPEPARAAKPAPERPIERPTERAAERAPERSNGDRTADEPRARSRVIVAGPSMSPPAPRVAARGPEVEYRERGQRHIVEAEPPPSTPLPARVTGRPSEAAVATTDVQPIEDARTRFERELERARARTAERDPSPTGRREPKVEIRGERQTMIVEDITGDAPTRDPSRPAVGTVISLPPRIKITERTPAVGRPAPGAQPVNPIRGRFAQQQQRGGPRGPGGPGRGPGGRPGGPGMSDFGRKKLPLGKKGKPTLLTTPAEHKRVIRIEDTIAIADLARSMGVKAPDVLKKLWGMGMTGVNINASIDLETAQILASEFGYEVQNVAFKEEDVFAQKADEAEQLVMRAPVVTVMGHVDHGKTSLLDAIRKARVAAGEAGGITQHVAAYKVAVPGHGDIVFLDTPGHEAFTEMRARGAQATDIVVLVVAANDGVMPQTVEALAHAKDAGVVIIVAVNKIDLPDASPDRVRQQLADHGLIPEEWGGDTIYVNVSALKNQNIDGLLEQIAVSAYALQLRANADKPASGVVIEARLDRNRGPMATILVQEGTLKVGDMLVAGRTFGKVRALLDDRGNNIEEAGPSTPLEILGLDGVPEAGDQVNAAEDDKVAKQVVEHRRQQYRKRELGKDTKVSLESMMARMNDSEGKELKIVLKADVQGSAEALKAALTKLSTEKVKVNVTMAGVGGITESDVTFARAGGAIIVGFHVRPAGKSTKLAEQEGVEIKLYDIIYDALDEVKAAMAGLLAPIKREIAMGKCEVRQTFTIPKMGTIAGCMVTEGKINRKAHLRIVRDAVQIYEGKVGSLRRHKDDVSEVQHGFECGVMVAGWNEIKTGDVIEAYEVIEEAAQL